MRIKEKRCRVLRVFTSFNPFSYMYETFIYLEDSKNTKRRYRVEEDFCETFKSLTINETYTFLFVERRRWYFPFSHYTIIEGVSE